MMLHCACLLLLLLLSPAAVSPTPGKFREKHILVQKDSCDKMMKNINGKTQCKETHTFIKQEYMETIVTLCEKTNTGLIPTEYDINNCKRLSKNPCTYKYTETKIKVITCKNGKPAHLEVWKS